VPVQNSEIADIFYEIADLLEIEDANPFRVRAYRNAARNIEGYPRRINEMVSNDEDLEDISGVGEDLTEKIQEIVNTGELKFLHEVRSRTPQSLVKLLDISGLGPKRVQKLYQELGITSIKSLRAAINDGKVAGLEGFGEKTVENIQEALESGGLENERTRLDIAEQFVTPFLTYLEDLDDVEKAAIAGSYRRRKATVGDLDIIAISKAGQPVSEAFVQYDSVDDIVSQGDTKSTVVLRSGLQVDLRIVPEQSYGAALLYFTGSKAHNIHLRNIAVDRGLKVNEYGVFENEARIAGESEAEIYEFFDLPFIQPELREDKGEIEAAQAGDLPDLVRLEDIRGDLQMHTDFSDGTQSLTEMAAAAQDLDYDYIAITDHTSYIGVTQGLDEDGMEDYLDQIVAYHQEHDGVMILKGLEVDIHEDGRLDMPDSVLRKLDVVVVAIHSHFDLSEKAQTERVIQAMDNPYVNILAHPTTRKIGGRDPIALNMEKVMRAAVERKIAFEVNASPDRLDIWDQHIRLARDLGLTLVISTDAHRASSLTNMKYGVYQARRGWAEKSMILNTHSLEDVRAFLDRN
jgi:DNA polymerase (family 10)